MNKRINCCCRCLSHLLHSFTSHTHSHILMTFGYFRVLMDMRITHATYLLYWRFIFVRRRSSCLEPIKKYFKRCSETNLCTQSRWSLLNRVNSIDVVDEEEDVKWHIFERWNFTRKKNIQINTYFVIIIVLQIYQQNWELPKTRTPNAAIFLLRHFQNTNNRVIDWLWIRSWKLIWLKQVEWTRNSNLELIGLRAMQSATMCRVSTSTRRKF